MVGINLAALWKNLTAGLASVGHGHALTGAEITGALPVAKGGTGAGDAAGARGNIGAAAEKHTHVQGEIEGLTYLQETVNLATYTDLEQIGVPEATTIAEIADAVPGKSLLLLTCSPTVAWGGITPPQTAYGLLILYKLDPSRCSLEFVEKERGARYCAGLFKPNTEWTVGEWKQLYREGDGVMKLVLSTSITVSTGDDWKYQSDPDAYYHYYTINGIDLSMQVIATLWNETSFPVGGNVCPVVCVAVSGTNKIIVWCADKPTKSKTLRLNFYKAL